MAMLNCSEMAGDDDVDSRINVFMLCFTLSLLPVMREFADSFQTNTKQSADTIMSLHLTHSLREMDIELMRRLAPRVNVIPVIGKSDTLTPSELRDFKKRIMEDIEYYSIPVYNFPYDVDEDDEETIEDNSELRVSLNERLERSCREKPLDLNRRVSMSRC